MCCSVALQCASAQRSTISINDGWTFRFDGDTAAATVHLPHCWNEDAYRTRDYRRGTGTYTKSLTIPDEFTGKRLFLKFDGAANRSDIAIDGKTVSSHTGGYSPHIADVTSYLIPGKTHQLTVAVDNADRTIPPYSADFTFMGGLYRDAWLTALSPVHADITAAPACGFRATPEFSQDGSAALNIRQTIVNDGGKDEKINLRVSLLAPDGTEIAVRDRQLKIKAYGSVPVSMRLDGLKNIIAWSPENPVLYTVKTDITSAGKILDSGECHTGFRTFGFDSDGRFLLNGSPYKLRGMCRHQDMKPMGIALSDEQHRRDMRMIKDMGANFIRISHYPQDDAVLEMCDRLGLIAWEEIPVIDYVPEGDAFADNCETMLRDMIRSHYNHPSIVMWGYMNEILLRMPSQGRDDTMRRTGELARRLENVVREEDASRLSTMAFHGSDVYHEAHLSEITDVKGWNLYQGWYGGSTGEFEKFLSRQHREHPRHRLIVSEYGAGSDLRLHSLAPEPFDFSMEYQQQYLEHYVPVIEDSAFVAGASHWNFIDFSSANRAESMPHINNKGLVTNDRRKKDVYHYYRSKWHDDGRDTVVHIATRDWPERTELISADGFVERPVKVYTNLPDIQISVNGSRFTASGIENCTAVFDVPLKAGENIITASAPGNPSAVLDAATVTVKGITVRNGIIDPGTGELAINAGSNCYFRSEASGLEWLPDRPYSAGSGYGHIGGTSSVSQDEVALTADGPLFQRSLTGVEEYRIDVVPGRYEVELLFSEPASPSALSAYMLGHNAGSGNRPWTAMDIAINGTSVERNFSPGNVAGVKSMVKRRYHTTADNSGITVTFTPCEGATSSLSAIKIRKL